MARYAIAVVGVLALRLDQCESQLVNCSGDLTYIHDGYCDHANNNLACGYDGGDCCVCTCADSIVYDCGFAGFNCLDPACPDEDPSPYPNCTGNVNWLNDGFCDPEANNIACDYDGGDCCECTCMDGPSYRCGSSGYDCADPACFDLASAIEYPECTGIQLSIGDGLCDAENNNQACGYDGGDCCLCTCSGRACVYNDFDCLDPSSAGTEIYDCNPPPRTGLPCSAEGQRVWVVENSAQARALAEAVNCSGGSFEVLWSGEVVVDKTIYVFDGTVLNVTGFGLTATMGGNLATRLLTVANASVHITGVNMSYGAGTVGGAVAAARSSLTFNGTNFFGNHAAGHGGAVFASDSSVVSFVGLSSFTDNTAAIDGGAVFVSGSLCTGEDATFFNNTAGGDGGAMMITEHSSLSWSGKATYRSNSAGGSAGAIALQKGSSASWYGKNIFDSNSALQHAGALRVLNDSHVSWIATTVFRNNQAVFTGGAMQVTSISSASWSGSTRYAENNGLKGGAIAISGKSTTSSGGNTTFWANTAEDQGGAVEVSDYSIVTWDGKTTFSRNLAGDGGAVYATSNSNLSFYGRTAFYGNLAVDVTTTIDNSLSMQAGGALCAIISTVVAFSGETVFADNRADSGGALYINEGHSALNGNATFFNNQADAGGALHLYRATAVWTGELSFVNNSASFAGGAMKISSSHAVFNGNTTFHGNSALVFGGAVYADTSPVISWNGEVEFVHNVANLGGGGYIFSSSASWSGNTTLAHNRAYEGGGGALLALGGSRVSWSGESMFLNNSAAAFGGAVYVTWDSKAYWSGRAVFLDCAAPLGGALFVMNGSEAEWSGRAEFTSNAADMGGAIGSIYLHEGNPQTSTITVNGSTTFANNTAAVAGGGIALNGMLHVTWLSRDVLFIGNSARLIGGAVSVSSASVGPVFTAIRFVDNSAEAGGGVYISGSGNVDVSVFDTTPVDATTFDGCEFVNNRATATGGAIQSVAGQDHIANTSFTGNTAAIGGALRLGGKVYLDNCYFVDNRSGEGAGPAVDNVGDISRITGSAFIGNIFDCRPGTYLEFNESGNVFGVACEGCGVLCQECTFGESPMVPTCTEIMQHATSSGGTTALGSISINPGFWRATSTGKEVLACHRDEVCLGGVTGTRGFCLDGYEGPYCSVCSNGHAAGFGFVCGKCSDKAGGIVLTGFLVVIVLVAAAAIASYTMSGQPEGDCRCGIERLTRFIPLQSTKITIVTLQIVTQFTAIANVTYPHVYQQFLDTLNVLNFDLGWISQLSVGCLFDMGIHGRLLIATIGPIIAITFLGVTYVIAANANRGSAEALSLIRHKNVSMVLLLTFLVYSSVSSILFQMFACEDLEDGKKYLRADYRVECDSSKHIAFQIYAAFMIVVYTVGIPTLYASLLFTNREVLKDGVGREENPSTKSFTDLWEPYKPSKFYYEVIECGRRVLLTGTVVFIYPDTSAQIAVTLMLAFVFAIISESISPFASRWDTWLNRTGHVVVFVSMYVALLLKVDVSNERSGSQKFFEAVLVAAHLGMILAVVLETSVVVCSLRDTVRGRISPIFRSTK